MITIAEGYEPSYVLVIIGVIQHVAAALEGASPEALSLAQLAEGLPNNPADEGRVIRNEPGIESSQDAKQWLCLYALQKVKDSVLVEENGRWKYANGYDSSSLRYRGKPVPKAKLNVAQLMDDRYGFSSELAKIFDPLKGGDGQIRPKALSLDDLRDSMREFGWITSLGTVVYDERGVLLSGHARVQVAKEQGITIPSEDKRTKRFGTGPTADVERLRFGILANTGNELSKQARQWWVAKLKTANPDATQSSLAHALAVSQKTISEDIKELEAQGFIPGYKPDRPKGGRPPGTGKRGGKPSQADDPAVMAALEQWIDQDDLSGRDELVQFVFDRTGIKLAHGSLEPNLKTIRAVRAALAAQAEDQIPEPTQPVEAESEIEPNPEQPDTADPEPEPQPGCCSYCDWVIRQRGS